MILKLAHGGEIHVNEMSIMSAWIKGRDNYIVRFGKDDTINVDEESYKKVVEWLDWSEPAPVEIEPQVSLVGLCGDLRGVYSMSAFARLFGFEMSSDEDWTWHDVAMAVADRIERGVTIAVAP